MNREMAEIIRNQKPADAAANRDGAGGLQADA